MSRLPKTCKLLLDKARDSATQAVSVFNDPRSGFRSGNFTVLMTIAWTALLHSHFKKEGIKYFYKQPNGRYLKIDDEYKAWELGECVKQIFDENDPIRKNIELFVKLRNKIEHRNLPGIDQELMGECQALVLNFESWLVKKYGQEASLIDTIFIPIQLTNTKRSLPKTKHEEKIIEFIKEFRHVLAPEVINSQQFSFKAFLVPKIGNHRSSSDIAIEYVKYDETNPKEMEKYDKAIVAIKEKHIPVANQNLYRPGSVIAELKRRGINKTIHWHTIMWQRFKVRPPLNTGNKMSTKGEYCVYDTANDVYLYTDKWLELLSKQ